MDSLRHDATFAECRSRLSDSNEHHPGSEATDCHSSCRWSPCSPLRPLRPGTGDAGPDSDVPSACANDSESKMTAPLWRDLSA